MKKITAWVLIICGLIGVFSMSACGNNQSIDDDSIRSMLTSHEWKNYSKKFHRNIILSFFEDGIWATADEGEEIKKNSRYTWAVRNGILYYKHYNVYSGSYETLELSYVKLNEDELDNGIIAMGNSGFYVSDKYLVYGSENPSIWEAK